MTRKTLTLTASLLTAAALAPAAAGADVQLGGAPTLRQVDAHHATLRFASDRLPRTPAGRIAARVVFSGKRAGCPPSRPSVATATTWSTARASARTATCAPGRSTPCGSSSKARTRSCAR
jgi:hypothetical protein